MAIEDAIYNQLANHAGLSALVGTRIYPVVVPATPTFPLVTYKRLSAERVPAMGVDAGIARATFEISAWADTHASALGVATETRAALRRWRETDAGAGVTIFDSFVKTDKEFYEPYDGSNKAYWIATEFDIVHTE